MMMMMMINCFCCMVDRQKARLYFQPGPLSEFHTIVNLRHAASRIWTWTEPEFRLWGMKLRSSDNHYATASCKNENNYETVPVILVLLPKEHYITVSLRTTAQFYFATVIAFGLFHLSTITQKKIFLWGPVIICKNCDRKSSIPKTSYRIIYISICCFHNKLWHSVAYTFHCTIRHEACLWTMC